MPTTRIPAKISRHTWAPPVDNFLSSSWTGFGHELDELPALRRQRHERPAAFGDLDESACDLLARGGGIGFAPPALDGAAEIFGIDPQTRCRAANLSGVLRKDFTRSVTIAEKSRKAPISASGGLAMGNKRCLSSPMAPYFDNPPESRHKRRENRPKEGDARPNTAARTQLNTPRNEEMAHDKLTWRLYLG